MKKEQQSSDTKNKATEIQPKKGFSARSAKLGKVSFIALLAGLAVLVALLLVVDKNENRYVFTIEDKSYTKDEVSRLTEYPVKVQKKAQNVAAEELYEALRLIKAGTKSGVDLSDKSINTQLQEIYKGGDISESDQKKYTDWFRTKAQSYVVSEAMTGTEVEGYLYDFYFGQHIQYGPRYKPEGLGDTRLIAQDKQYAKERADYYRSSLESGAISPEQAMQEIKQDPKLGNDSSSSNHSVYFASVKDEQNWRQQVYSEAAADYIQNQKTLNKPSSIQTGKALASPESTQAEDMNFYFVYLKKASDNKVDAVKLSKTLAALKSEYKGFKK